MSLLILWSCFALAVGVGASSRGRSGVGWFLLSAIVSPLIGAVLLMLMSNLRTEQLLKAQHAQLLQALASRECDETDESVLASPQLGAIEQFGVRYRNAFCLSFLR